MGNSISNPSEPKNIKSLSQTIDDIAIHYILKQNVIDLLRLTDKEYYDNLIILIGKVFDTRLNNLEIGVLSGRINETIQDAVFSLMPATDNIKNKMISNISKFYIKLMMIYSAIVATIDPQYSYEDEQGQTQFFYLKDLSSLKKLPKQSNPVLHQLTNPMNLCRKRITILKNKLETNEDDFIILNPGDKLCSLDSASKLTDEVGIKELDLLYYDIFDYSNKSWKKRSREMEEKYKKDLVLFYQIFTGKENMPSEIKSFKDIELLDFKNLEYCNDPLFKQDFTVSKNDNLIKDYIKQINIIEEEVKGYRTKLTDIIKEIFLIKMVDDEQTYSINPTLTMSQILKLEEETRDTIINLYTNCERNFIKALLLFEEIYDIKSRDSQQYRYNNIEQGIVTTGLNTTSFSNFDKTPVPPSYNKEPLFKNTMNINSLSKDPSFMASPSPMPSALSSPPASSEPPSSEPSSETTPSPEPTPSSEPSPEPSLFSSPETPAPSPEQPPSPETPAPSSEPSPETTPAPAPPAPAPPAPEPPPSLFSSFMSSPSPAPAPPAAAPAPPAAAPAPSSEPPSAPPASNSSAPPSEPQPAAPPAPNSSAPPAAPAPNTSTPPAPNSSTPPATPASNSSAPPAPNSSAPPSSEPSPESKETDKPSLWTQFKNFTLSPSPEQVNPEAGQAKPEAVQPEVKPTNAKIV
jgi:hypothetical protein